MFFCKRTQNIEFFWKERMPNPLANKYQINDDICSRLDMGKESLGGQSWSSPPPANTPSLWLPAPRHTAAWEQYQINDDIFCRLHTGTDSRGGQSWSSPPPANYPSLWPLTPRHTAALTIPSNDDICNRLHTKTDPVPQPWEEVSKCIGGRAILKK